MTGPKDPIMAMVPTSMPVMLTSPACFRIIIRKSMANEKARIARFVTERWEASRRFKSFCILPSSSERSAISFLLLPPCWYWIVSSSPRRESRIKLFRFPNPLRNSIPLSAPLLPKYRGIAAPTTRYPPSARTAAARENCPMNRIITREVSTAMAIGEIVWA